MTIYDIIIENKLDAVLVTSSISIRYLSGFTGTESVVLISKKNKYIFVDSRYFEQAKMQCLNFEVILHSKIDLTTKLNKIINNNKWLNIGFERDQLTIKDYEDYNTLLNCDLKGISLTNIRTTKTDYEIELIRKACSITDKAFAHLLNFIKIGMSENEINIELQKFILENGASGLSFDTIIASGIRGCMPHGVASNKKIEENDFVTIDFGVYYNGYVSDMTRTFVVGKNPDKKLVEIYYIVKEAQEKTIRAIKSGIKVRELDKVARDFIIDKGYGEYFSHGTGHGIGLEIHELPYISPNSNEILEIGNIITVEPGIYIPNFGGVRIEDDVIVTENGYDIINKTSKELIMIDGR